MGPKTKSAAKSQDTRCCRSHSEGQPCRLLTSVRLRHWVKPFLPPPAAAGVDHVIWEVRGHVAQDMHSTLGLQRQHHTPAHRVEDTPRADGGKRTLGTHDSL